MNNKTSLFASSKQNSPKNKKSAAPTPSTDLPEESFVFEDDDSDEDYRPMKTNKRKSMAPLFVYLLLKNCSNKNSPLRQQQIINMLKKYPFEISIERKALSRIIHNLADSDLDIHTSPKRGTWYEEADW